MATAVFYSFFSDYRDIERLAQHKYRQKHKRKV